MPKMVIPSKLTELPKVLQAILELAQAQGFGEDERFAIKLATDEAISNAIHHGNKNDPNKQVTVDYDVDGQALKIEVTDEGPGFKPDELPDPTLEENLTTPHGRGVMLIEAYMTEVSFNDKGNQITMIKRKGCKLPARG